MNPIYTPFNVEPAYQLNWGLTLFWRQIAIPEGRWLVALQEVTEPDGVRVLKHRITDSTVSQFFVSSKPSVAPKELLRSVKGRLQHIIQQHVPRAFQRNYCLRSVGTAKREVIEAYVASQLEHHRMADPHTEQRLARFQRSYPDVDLKKPMFTAHGEYWYNLHIVVVNDKRWAESREAILEKLLVTIERAARKHGHRLSRAAVLPEHIHLALGCEIAESPEQVALGYLNNCAYVYGMKPIFRFSYYVGTFGEYDRGAV
jgi:REP element-mobilizing transposase RayT